MNSQSIQNRDNSYPSAQITSWDLNAYSETINEEKDNKI